LDKTSGLLKDQKKEFIQTIEYMESENKRALTQVALKDEGIQSLQLNIDQYRNKA
jgi:hypothetical protein